MSYTLPVLPCNSGSCVCTHTAASQGMLNLARLSSTASLCSLLPFDLNAQTVIYIHAAGWQHSEKSVTSPKLPGKSKEVVTILHRLHFTSALKRMATLVRVRSAPSCLDIGITLYNEQSCKLLQALQTCLFVSLFFVHCDKCYMGSCTFTPAFMSEVPSLYV